MPSRSRPHRTHGDVNPKTSLYVRRNGALTFTITGGTHGVPYAQDRLLVIWLATVFKVCGSPETNAIAFDSLREVARSLGKASSGQQRQRIETGFLRLFDATFHASDSRPNAIRRERYQLMQRMRALARFHPRWHLGPRRLRIVRYRTPAG